MLGWLAMRGQQPIRLRRLVPIVQQETHPHPAISRGQEAVVDKLTREVVVKDIVLQVEGFFRPVDHEGPGGKGIDAGGQEVESRRPRVVNRLGLEFLPQAGPFGPVKGAGDGARVIIRDGWRTRSGDKGAASTRGRRAALAAW